MNEPATEAVQALVKDGETMPDLGEAAARTMLADLGELVTLERLELGAPGGITMPTGNTIWRGRVIPRHHSEKQDEEEA